jgi:hypothetical protein
MPDILDTHLSTIADNLVESLFEDTGSSSNVIVPVSQDGAEPVKEPKTALKEKAITNPVDDEIDTAELIGDLLKENPTNEPAATPDTKTEVKPTKKEKVKPALGFNVEDLYDEDLLSPFADPEDPEKYAPVDDINALKELIKANKKEAVETAREDALKDYKDSLPEAAKVLLEYAEKGGENFGALIKYLSQDQKQKEITLENLDGCKEVIREYYSSQDWSEEEIQDEIEDLLDSGEDRVKERATRLKPKLDAMNQKRIEAELKQAEELSERKEQARQFYVQNVVETLKKGKLGSLPITKDEQADIFKGLIEEKYNSLGGVTNRLGALLDKIQYIEPNYEVLGKVMLLLTDPEGYEKKIIDRVKQEVTADTVKKLKTVQGIRKTGSPAPQDSSNKPLKLNSGFRNPFLD